MLHRFGLATFVSLLALSGCALNDADGDIPSPPGGNEQPSRAPTAGFTFEQEANTLNVAFSAAPSSDPHSGELSYSWDFGDGTNADSRDYTKTYDSAGAKQVVLTVTNTDGLSGTATETVTVAPTDGDDGDNGSTPNRPPTVSIVGDNPRETTQELNYLSAETTDPDGDSLTYLWEVTTDVGEEDTVLIENPTEKETGMTINNVSYRGEYTLQLTVNDGKGGSASDTVDFIYRAPLAVGVEIEGENPRTAAVGEPIALVASVENFEDLILQTQWSIVEGSENNGSFDSPKEYKTSVTFTEEGSYTVQVEVFESDFIGDVLDTDTVVVNIE